MAHNRTTTYSAPYRRNNLLGLPQYVASDSFPSLGNWDRARTDDLYVVRGTTGRANPVLMIVVGCITSDKANLKPHGNYNPKYTTDEELPKKAKLQFYITGPADDPDFSADFNLALKRLSAMQEEVASSPSRREHFIEGHSLKMNFMLFEPKDQEDEGTYIFDWFRLHADNDSRREPMAVKKEGTSAGSIEEGGRRDDATVADDVPPYEVDSSYRYAWDAASKTHHNNIMQVYGHDELLVDYRRFPRVLAPGTTVEVAFILKHYSIREKTGVPPSDTYTALVQRVSVLRQAEKKVRQTATPKRRPLLVPQLPSRGTLRRAADTFSPVRKDNRSKSPSIHRTDREGTPLSSCEAGPSTTVGKSQMACSEPPEATEGDDDEEVVSLPKDMLELLYPLLLRGMRKDPSSILYRQQSPLPHHRPTTPTVSTPSTISSVTDDCTSPADAVTSNRPLVDLKINTSDRTASATGHPSTSNSDQQSSSIPNESDLSVLSSSDEEQPHDDAQENELERAPKKARMSSEARKSKGKKAAR